MEHRKNRNGRRLDSDRDYQRNRKNGRTSSKSYMKNGKIKYFMPKKKEIGNVPTKWCYDTKTSKLYMMFEQDGVKYFIFQKAIVTYNYGGFATGVTGDGKEYVLLTSNRRRGAKAA